MKVVIGLGFGDEGKGLVTDWLCGQSPDSVVVRFNGGPQAGHTVHRDGKRHIFASFGSGTLNGNKTYWDSMCPVDPDAFLSELRVLHEQQINPDIFISHKCPIITPYDKFSNQQDSLNLSHGTCGMGFGKTIEREENHISLKVIDLLYPKIFKERLKVVKEYYHHKGVKLPVSWVEGFEIACKHLLKFFILLEDSNFPNDYIICEGAQGLLLDKDIGFFPNVTRSNTTTENLGINKFNINTKYYLVTRAYQTRHGNGFMTNLDKPHNIKSNPFESNVYNRYQGEFKRSLLDVDLLQYGIKNDPALKLASGKNRNLVITCLDHVQDEFRFTQGENIVSCHSEKQFVEKISKILNITNVYVSHGDTAEDIKRFM